MNKMKFLTSSLLVLGLCSTSAIAQVTEKSSFEDKFAYSYGYTLAKTQQKILPDVNVNIALQAFRDFANDKKPALSEEDMRKILEQALNKENAKPLNDFQAQSAENKKLEQQFFKQNARNRNITKLKSGVQIEWLSPNKKTGRLTANDYQQVEIRYEGRLLDGTIFDSSIARDESKKFNLNQLITGLQHGISFMSTGEKARIFIPSELAYGELGSGAIPSSAMLIFDVELISAQ